jgi:hypothetical protein
MPCTAKKTTKVLIEGGNNYVITVKGNQPRLLGQLKTITEAQKDCERFVDIEKTRGRITCRLVKVFTELENIDLNWVGVQSLIQVERRSIRSGKKYQKVNHYISSLATNARTFADGIRYSLGN